MGSALPKVDESTGWPSLPCCPHRHKVSTPCPPSDTWLVLHFCPACDEPKRFYCRTHRDRHMPALTLMAPLPELDIQRRQAGEREAS